MTGDEKGEWAKTADEGIVPDELSGDDESGPVGREAASDEPATDDGIDLAAGDEADATTRRRRRAARARRARPQGRGRRGARAAEGLGERWPRGPGSLAGVRPEGETRAGKDRRS